MVNPNCSSLSLLVEFCPEPETIENAIRSVPKSPYKVGTNITYMCDRCYTGGGISTCQCNGEWSPVECTSSK